MDDVEESTLVMEIVSGCKRLLKALELELVI